MADKKETTMTIEETKKEEKPSVTVKASDMKEPWELQGSAHLASHLPDHGPEYVSRFLNPKLREKNGMEHWEYDQGKDRKVFGDLVSGRAKRDRDDARKLYFRGVNKDIKTKKEEAKKEFLERMKHNSSDGSGKSYFYAK